MLPSTKIAKTNLISHKTWSLVGMANFLLCTYAKKKPYTSTLKQMVKIENNFVKMTFYIKN